MLEADLGLSWTGETVEMKALESCLTREPSIIEKTRNELRRPSISSHRIASVAKSIEAANRVAQRLERSSVTFAGDQPH